MFLKSEGIFTAENIAIARINARMLTSVSVFSAELKFASKVGKLVKLLSTSLW